MKIVVATKNKHKVSELKEMLNMPNIEFFTISDFNLDIDIVEDGSTFEENAMIKAKAVYNALHDESLIVIADDSGLCVDALNGAPGVYSARYCGHHGDDQANRDKLLKEMQGKENRAAHFTCALALVYPDGNVITATGETHGKILYKEDGNGGFGYDPLFESDDLQKSFGVATAQEKNAVSHRFRALKNLLTVLQKED